MNGGDKGLCPGLAGEHAIDVAMLLAVLQYTYGEVQRTIMRMVAHALGSKGIANLAAYVLSTRLGQSQAYIESARRSTTRIREARSSVT